MSSTMAPWCYKQYVQKCNISLSFECTEIVAYFPDGKNAWNSEINMYCIDLSENAIILIIREFFHRSSPNSWISGTFFFFKAVIDLHSAIHLKNEHGKGKLSRERIYAFSSISILPFTLACVFSSAPKILT